MTALSVIVLLVAAVGMFATQATSETATPAPKPRPVKPQRPSDTTCPGSRRAIRYYRAAYTDHRLTMNLAAAPAFVRERCGTTRRRATEWRSKAYQARRALQAWVAYQFRWEQWLPDNWARLGACETGYGRRPGNWRHSNRSFVSAFGITRVNYSRDAAAAGTPQWDDRHPPTPREQYLTALAHYHMHGDGWTCPGP